MAIKEKNRIKNAFLGGGRSTHRHEEGGAERPPRLGHIDGSAFESFAIAGVDGEIEYLQLGLGVGGGCSAECGHIRGHRVEEESTQI